jgi:hypothetical protein
MRTGIASIPLDYGTCPRWLFEKMTRLGRLIAEAIVLEFGPEEFIRRLANPFFFQSLGSVLAFDWNSSGLTTTLCGALKEALRGTEKDLGIFVAGGKGKTSRKTPQQIEDFGWRFGLGFAPRLIYASKMSAKVDSAALQDGFQLYHHTFLFTKSGRWTVVQQGMNTEIKQARRYHWNSEALRPSEQDSGNSSLLSGQSFVEEPQAAICSDVKVKPLNLVAKESSQTRDYSVDLIRENFNSLLCDLKRINQKNVLAARSKKLSMLPLPFMSLPSDEQQPPAFLSFDYRRVEKVLLGAREQNPANFEELLSKTSVGPTTLRALALVSEIIYGAKPSFKDPVRYSFAHGGKDGYPYAVDKENYEKSIAILQRAVAKAKIGQVEKIKIFKKLS